jgi:hypothetical protein
MQHQFSKIKNQKSLLRQSDAKLQRSATLHEKLTFTINQMLATILSLKKEILNLQQDIFEKTKNNEFIQVMVNISEKNKTDLYNKNKVLF